MTIVMTILPLMRDEQEKKIMDKALTKTIYDGFIMSVPDYMCDSTKEILGLPNYMDDNIYPN